MKIQELSIDLETYSDVDISKCGVYKYAESDNFEILLFGVSVDGGDGTVYDLACGDTIPEEILDALTDDTITKWAFNASFERICISNWLKNHYPDKFKGYGIPEDPASKYLDPASWKCTMIWSAYMGLPLSLESVGAVLKLQDQKAKTSSDTSALHAKQPKLMAAEPETYRSTRPTNGKPLRHTISVMSM